MKYILNSNNVLTSILRCYSANAYTPIMQLQILCLWPKVWKVTSRTVLFIIQVHLEISFVWYCDRDLHPKVICFFLVMLQLWKRMLLGNSKRLLIFTGKNFWELLESKSVSNFAGIHFNEWMEMGNAVLYAQS